VRRRLRGAIGVLALGALAACSSGSSSGKAVTPNSRVATPNANGCLPAPKLVSKMAQFPAAPALQIDRTTYTARIVTNCGTIIVSLDGKHAPQTVNSFAFLAKSSFFNDTPCHRLTTSGIYVLQCGDPSGSGSGGPGYTIPDENLAHATYPAGTLAMANTGSPHTGGSQFFIVYRDSTSGLSPLYTPFGHITSGLDVLKKIAAAGSKPPGDGAPVQPVAIESVGVTKG